MILELALFSQLVASCVPAAPQDPRDFPQVLAAVARTESGLSPLAIHDNTTGLTFNPKSLDIAESIALSLVSEKGHSVDLGLMQINSANLSHLGMKVQDAFDPCRSVRAGATILREGYHRALRSAFSIYNTGGPTKGIENGYVGRVEAQQALLNGDPAPLAKAVTVRTTQVAEIVPDYHQACGYAPPSWDGWAMAAHQMCINKQTETARK